MADNTLLSAPDGTGDTVRTVARSAVKTAVVGIDLGIGTGSESLMAGAMPVNDNSGSLTVDAPVGIPVFVRLSDGTSAIATLPVSAASLPLPTGAATAAKQPALGTAGSASADVITIQGIASMTAVKVDGSGVTQPVSIAATVNVTVGNSTLAVTQSGTWTVASNADATIGGTTAPSKLLLVGGKSSDGTPQYQPIPLTASGAAVKTDASATTQPVSGTVTANAGSGTFTISGAVTQSGTWNVGTVTTVTTVSAVTTVSTVTSLSQWSGNAIDTNSGSKSAGTLRVVLATDQPALTNKLLVTPDANSAVNISQMNGVTVTMGNGASGTGVQRVTIASDSTGVIGATQSGTWNVGTVTTVTTVTTVAAVTAITNALPAGTNTIGGVYQVPQTSGGCSMYSVISSGAANQDSAAVKGSAGQLYGYSLFNTTASARYVKLYNLASGATSASTPAMRIYLPPTGGANMPVGDSGVAFGTGICIRITTGAADNDTGACSANDVLANVIYK